eukprot:360766-Chlamydomonas_euryale.AAC.21
MTKQRNCYGGVMVAAAINQIVQKSSLYDCSCASWHSCRPSHPTDMIYGASHRTCLLEHFKCPNAAARLPRRQPCPPPERHAREDLRTLIDGVHCPSFSPEHIPTSCTSLMQTHAQAAAERFDATLAAHMCNAQCCAPCPMRCGPSCALHGHRDGREHEPSRSAAASGSHAHT